MTQFCPSATRTGPQPHPTTNTRPQQRTLYALRSSMTWLMSTSLKVDSMAYVFCAPLSRSATRMRSRVILTRLMSEQGEEEKQAVTRQGYGSGT